LSEGHTVKRLAVLACLACAAHVAARSVDLGVVGPTYRIEEPHLLDDIERRLREKQRTGELQRLAVAARQRGVAAVREPAPVDGLRLTEHPRTFHVDPSFTLDRNIADSRGRLLFAAGTRKNPLEVVSLSRHLLFFDARDPRQVRHARELKQRYAGRVRPILTGGSYLDLMKAWREPVYYDQHGTLTRRLGIRQVPALVSQDGLRLRIDELRLP
jgi:conjugal transfer pilus assembly protein TraW